MTPGIRPEDLEPVQEEGSTTLTAPLAEPLDADTLVHGHFGTDRTDMTIRLNGNHAFADSEAPPLRVAPDGVHLFDPETDWRLGWQPFR